MLASEAHWSSWSVDWVSLVSASATAAVFPVLAALGHERRAGELRKLHDDTHLDAVLARDYPVIQAVTIYLAVITMAVNLLTDVLYTMQWSGTQTSDELQMTGRGGWESRQFKVNFSYLIGNNQVKARKRSTGVEDEKSRAGGGGGMGR